MVPLHRFVVGVVEAGRDAVTLAPLLFIRWLSLVLDALIQPGLVSSHVQLGDGLKFAIRVRVQEQHDGAAA